MWCANDLADTAKDECFSSVIKAVYSAGLSSKCTVGTNNSKHRGFVMTSRHEKQVKLFH